MSLKSIKTNGYASIMDEFLWVMDLYDRNNRNSRLREKRSYDSQQDIFTESLNEKIITGICSPRDKIEGITLVNGILDFSEVAVSFIFAKPVISPLSREDIHQSYIKHILCPLLASYIDIFGDFHDCSPFMKHLASLLTAIDDNNDEVASASRKFLSAMISRDDCNLYRDDLLAYIRDIRADSAQRRDTIDQRIKLAISSLDYIKNNDEKKKHILLLESLQSAFHASMAIIRFDIKTGLGKKVARLYNNMTKKGPDRFDDVRQDSLSCMIIRSIYANKKHWQHFTKDAEKNIDKLWQKAIGNNKKIANPYFIQNIETLFHLLTHPGYETRKITEYSKSIKFISAVKSRDNLFYLRPYSFLLTVLNHIEENRLEEALNLLDGDDANQLENTAGPLPYYAATLFVGLTIKTAQSQIKNGSLNPLIQIIINTQPRYEDVRFCDASTLQLNFESFISTPYSHTLLRSIEKYNTIIRTRLCPSIKSPPQAILDTWNEVERKLVGIQHSLVGVNDAEREKKITSLTKSDKNKSLITYLPNSTLYNCVREYEGLKSYLTLSKSSHPATFQMLEDTQYRMSLLRAIDPDQYKLDSGGRD